jgi:hypothetical protein
MQESQIMFAVNWPAVFAALYPIALVLLFLGMREQTGRIRRLRLMRMGGVLFGFRTILVGFLWYATQPQMRLLDYVQMRPADVMTLTALSSVGGAIIRFVVRMD